MKLLSVLIKTPHQTKCFLGHLQCFADDIITVSIEMPEGPRQF